MGNSQRGQSVWFGLCISIEIISKEIHIKFVSVGAVRKAARGVKARNIFSDAEDVRAIAAPTIP